MRALLMLLLLTLLIVASPAGATTLTITGGAVSGETISRDTIYGFSGPGFFVTGPRGFGVQAGGFGVSLSMVSSGTFSVGFGFDTIVVVDGVGTCVAMGPGFPLCGFLQLSSTPVPLTTEDYFSPLTIEGDVPFTATGRINVGGEGFDVVGQGTMHYRLAPAICEPSPCLPFKVGSAVYVFAPVNVTEPSTLFLLSIAISTVALAAGRRWRPRRTDH